MNCPNCGAENEVEARFCVECGTPLENQLDSPPPPAAEDEDLTLISTVSPVAEDAKTVSVTQDELAEVEPEVSKPPPEVRPTPPPSSSTPPVAKSPGKGQGAGNQRNIIIMVIVVLIVLCCCCATLGVAATAGSDVIQDILYEYSLAPAPLLLFV